MVFMNATHLGDAKNEQNTNCEIIYSNFSEGFITIKINPE